MIVAFKRGDVNGDGIPDNVYLTGNRTPDIPFIQDITLVIQDGRTGMYTRAEMKDNMGYSPMLFLGDFTGDGVDDIMVTIVSGGSGGITYHYIFTDIGNVPQMIFDFNTFNNFYKYDVNYLDNYEAEVINRTSNIRYIIDLKYKGKQYLDEIYTADGKLKRPVRGWVSGLSGLYPVDFDVNGVYELLGYQKIAGQYSADSLGYVQTTLKWNGNAFVPVDQVVAVQGMDEQ